MRALGRTIGLLLAVMTGAALAQDHQYELRQVTVQVKDRFYRQMDTEPNTAWLGVRLAEQQDPAIAQGTQIGAIDRAYTMGDEAQKFAIANGEARPVFVVYKDETKQLNYEVVAIVREDGREQVVRLDKGVWPVSKVSTTRVDVRAPVYIRRLRGLEVATFVLYFLLVAVVIYLLFGRTLFRRLLFNRRWQAGSAETLSNVIMLIMAIVLLVVLYLLVFSPPMLIPGDYGYSCAAVMVGFVVMMIVVSLVSTAVTAKR